MGNRLIWNEQNNIGVEIIDREHKKLFGILNKLFNFGHREGKSHFACQEAIKYFKDHAIQHFADEETYMASIDYPGLDTHRRIHKDFRERLLPALENELEQTGFSETSVQHFLGVCAGWLIGHTLIEDHMIVSGESIKHWEKLLPEEEQTVMGQTIASLLHSMFRLNPQLISNCYAGEKFGNGIYCRLIYHDSDKKSWESFLLFEEQLIGSTIGNVIETGSEATDMMLANVVRYAAKQFTERIKQHFSSLEQFEITAEQLLTYEQFHKAFKQQSPQFSLLFDTGRGYFAYCMTTSETPNYMDGVSAVTEDAVAEIENYLHLSILPAESEDQPHPEGSPKAAANRKKKILVVDDSSFMRKVMQDLLSREYEVMTADSGMSAIRSITLVRPDLVLLDYEMPVCNGNQALEMIRSEKDFTDIPVIFLTNRVDRESVRKALSLKPEGYLTKSLPMEFVKREIDHFFERDVIHNKSNTL